MAYPAFGKHCAEQGTCKVKNSRETAKEHPCAVRRMGVLYLNSDEFMMALPKLSGIFFVLSVSIHFHFLRSAVVPRQDPLKVNHTLYLALTSRHHPMHPCQKTNTEQYSNYTKW